MNAADLMSTDVMTLNTEMNVIDAARTMLRHRISGLPVLDWQGKLIGMLTEGDLLRRSETGTGRHRARWLELLLGPGRAAEDFTAAHARKVGEVMTERVISVAPDTPLDEVVTAMERHRVRRIPVVAEGRLVGILSRADLLRGLVAQSEMVAAAPGGDEEIRGRVLAELRRQSWAPLAAINVAVKNGVVELRGSVTDDRERAALTVLCENIPGVTAVVDHLVFVEPLSGMVVGPEDAPAAPAGKRS